MRRSILSLYAGFIFTILFTSTNLMYAQWRTVNGTGGSISSFVVSLDGTNIFAGIDQTEYGVFRSTNNGEDWVPVNSGLDNGNIYSSGITSLAISPNGKKIFAGNVSGGVYLSTNNGTNWTPINSGLTDNFVYALSASDTNVFAGTDSGHVYVSKNNGTGWSLVNSGLPNAPIITLVASSNNTNGTNLFAGIGFSYSGYGVYLSTNNGTNWISISSNLPFIPITALVVSRVGADSINLFVGSYDYGIYLSTNKGKSWMPIDSGLTNNTITSLAVSHDSIGGTNVFAGTDGDGVYLSTNNGTSWTAVNSGLTFCYISALAVSGLNLLAGTDGIGVWKRPLSEMITSVKYTASNLPANFSLEQNYPNPFNPSTTINYYVAKAGLVTIKVYDILGREVATLVNEQKNAGSYNVLFNAATLASGVYFYRMQAGDFVEIKKLSLLK